MKMRWDPLVDKPTEGRRQKWAIFVMVGLVALALAAFTVSPQSRRKPIKYNLPVEIQYVDDLKTGKLSPDSNNSAGIQGDSKEKAPSDGQPEAP